MANAAPLRVADCCVRAPHALQTPQAHARRGAHCAALACASTLNRAGFAPGAGTDIRRITSVRPARSTPGRGPVVTRRCAQRRRTSGQETTPLSWSSRVRWLLRRRAPTAQRALPMPLRNARALTRARRAASPSRSHTPCSPSLRPCWLTTCSSAWCSQPPAGALRGRCCAGPAVDAQNTRRLLSNRYLRTVATLSHSVEQRVEWCVARSRDACDIAHTRRAGSTPSTCTVTHTSRSSSRSTVSIRAAPARRRALTHRRALRSGPVLFMPAAAGAGLHICGAVQHAVQRRVVLLPLHAVPGLQRCARSLFTLGTTADTPRSQRCRFSSGPSCSCTPSLALRCSRPSPSWRASTPRNEC